MAITISNKDVVRRLYKEVWNERKLQVMDELVSKSHALIDPMIDGSSVGPAAYLEQVQRLVSAFPDLRFTIDDYVCEKDKVAAVWCFTGTHKGEAFGIAPTNRKVSVPGITIHQLSGGKILDSQAVWDTLGLMVQLGASRPTKIEMHALSARTI
jgi:steroid delta-isomerase-like uncharacterized protein